MNGELERAADLLRTARRVVVSTGAGVSKESGIPTFRDALQGLWARYDPQELATEAGFRADPRRVWSWYAERRRQIERCQPHAGHRALARLATLVPELVLITQNIDGLHARAGSPDVVELHGNITRAKCLDRGHPLTGAVPESEQPPPCPACGSPLRPDVVWFGEMLPEAAVERAWRVAGRCDLMLVVGTSGTVWPAAELPHLAREAGAPVVEINPEASELTPFVDVFVAAPAGQALPRLVALLSAATRT
ncbi:NAD-dependent deacylase [soil metagenome]